MSGLVLLYLTEQTLVATQNPNFFPSAILLGAFLVPVTFFAYLYERLPGWEVPLPALAACFLWGGVLGTVVAGTLEYNLAVSLGFLPKLFIGVIEEGAKLIVPLVFYFLGRFFPLLRILAGPLAGAANMPYRRFLAANVAGAFAWATTMGTLAFFFGKPVAALLSSLGVWALVAVGVFLLARFALGRWLRARRSAPPARIRRPAGTGQGDAPGPNPHEEFQTVGGMGT